VTNLADTPLTVQATGYLWSQPQGDASNDPKNGSDFKSDVLTPTRDLIISPPLFEVPAHAQQIVRIGLRIKPERDRELDFRLFLREIPPPPKPGFVGVQVALQMSLPVFLAPVAPSQPSITWSAQRTTQGLRLEVENTGGAHTQITHLVATLGKTVVYDQALALYVLPASHQQILIPLHAGQATQKLETAPLTVQALTDAGPTLEATLPVVFNTAKTDLR
jgi:fimbrial chaperone protein